MVAEAGLKYKSQWAFSLSSFVEAGLVLIAV